MTNSKILLKNGIVYSAGKRGKIEKLGKEALDIRISGGIISDIKKGLTPAAGEEAIDLKGATVVPGFIDLHVQFRDFDLEDVEDFASGSKAAAAGGFTTVLDYANSRPQRDNINSLREATERVKENACIEVLLVAAVTQGLAGEQLTNMVELAENGAVAFSDDGLPIMNMGVFRAALSYMALTDCFLISHAEDKHLSGRGAMNESPQSTRLGIPCIPAASEAVSVAREIEVLRLQGGHLHFTHVSTAPSVALIRKARKEGLHVTSDVTPHHLVLLDEDVVTYDGNFKMNPPLRSTHDQKVLIEAVMDGTIDAIATDHAPWSALYKIRPFEDCTFGVLGLETAFPLTYEKLVLSGCISFERLIEMLTSEPAKILKMADKQIAPGTEANLAIVDLNQTWTYDVNKSFSKSRNSPFHGRRLKGKNVLTLYKGQVVFQDSNRFSTVLAGK